MNQKKCPKCGEMNPGEAVMCWACYTPLAGTAGAGAAGGAGTATMATSAVAVHDEEGEKKAIAPWQLGVVGVALLLALGLGARTMMGGGSEPEEPPMPPGGALRDPGNPGVPPPQPPSPGVQPPLSPGNNPAPPIVVAPYVTAVPPNPSAAWGVMAIVPTEPNTGSARAASLAAFARRQQMRSGNWKAMHIYVFQDQASANLFKQFQVPRRSEALGADDYPSLAAIWPRCLARYEFNGGRESVRYPNRSPNSWWFSSRA